MAELHLIVAIAKGDIMKLLAVNGSPRKTMNTGLLLEKIVEGAASEGAAADGSALHPNGEHGTIK
ncbi:hypothetical protein AGMMS49974_07270 [Deltaproteobacteria bacterium]|nr:hypothetical protein AGMMS49974_07270 [Deltaproteobacteria bacterium]